MEAMVFIRLVDVDAESKSVEKKTVKRGPSNDTKLHS